MFRKPTLTALALFNIIFLCGCFSRRPANLPPDAAKTLFGESWVACDPVSADSRTNCAIYGKDGNLWLKGPYVLRDVVRDQHEKPVYSEPKNVPAQLSYSSIDGPVIWLTNNAVLLPEETEKQN